jgi:hypothetical protein
VIDRRTFTRSLPLSAGALLGAHAPRVEGWSASSQAASGAPASRLAPTRVTKIRRFYPPNYNANGPQAFPQSNMVVLVDTEAGITGVGQTPIEEITTGAPGVTHRRPDGSLTHW